MLLFKYDLPYFQMIHFDFRLSINVIIIYIYYRVHIRIAKQSIYNTLTIIHQMISLLFYNNFKCKIPIIYFKYK